MKLTLEEYSGWIPQELEKLIRPTTAKAQKILDGSIRSIGEARGFFEDLSRKGDKDAASKRDPVSYKAAKLIGHASREASQNLGKVQVPREVSWDELKVFKDSVSGLTRSLRDTRAKTAAQLSGFYILDMRSFSGVNDRIGKQAERLSQFLEGEGSSLQKARTLTSILADAQAVRGEIVERRVEENKLAQDKENLAARAMSLSKEIDEVENQAVLNELLDIERSLRSEGRHFRTENLAHLKRPLRRLRDLSLRGEVPLGLDEREALGLYIESPYRSFLSKRSGPFLVGILGSLKTALVSKKLGFKPKKTTRVLAQLEQLTSTDELYLRQERGRTLLVRRRKLLEDPNCRKLYESRKEMQVKMAEARKAIAEVEEKLRSARQKSNASSERMRELLSLLESKTRDYTAKVVEIEKLPASPISAG